MSGSSRLLMKNRLLSALAPASLAHLEPHLKQVDLPLKKLLVETDQPTGEVYFLTSGLASVVAANGDREHAEVGHIGREGMSGSHVVLGVGRTPSRTFMQIQGSGMRLRVSDLRHALEDDASLRDLLLLYIHSADLQLAHSALANARYNMNERLARWLLMCHDRLQTDHLPLTHESLSLMLGVRRSGITNEIHVIEGLGAIKATRGDIQVLDRERLVKLAGGSYGMPEREYERLIGMSSGHQQHPHGLDRVE
jgi:CRP-like cAMP-binding protein